MLWQLTALWPMTSRALCQVFWCTSPLLLGHGAIVSADALSGVAMCFILWTTILLWKNPNWFGFALSGLAWGLAIGTKFTFGPLYLAFPLGMADFVTHYNDDRLHNAIGYKTRNEVFSEAKNQNMSQLR
jgi:hypothetical protein